MSAKIINLKARKKARARLARSLKSTAPWFAPSGRDGADEDDGQLGAIYERLDPARREQLMRLALRLYTAELLGRHT